MKFGMSHIVITVYQRLSLNQAPVYMRIDAYWYAVECI